MDFAYHWHDENGIHFTFDKEEADKALHEGKFIELVIVDKYSKDGSSRTAE